MRTQRKVLNELNAKRLARGAEQHDIAQLERFYKKYGEAMPQPYRKPAPVYCSEGCGRQLEGIELNKSTRRCLECTSRIETHRREAQRQSAKRQAYQKAYQSKKRAEFALGKKFMGGL